MKLIHYGCDRFLPSMMNPVKNGGWVKPASGGLWTSPVYSDYGWKDWCETEEFSGFAIGNYFILSLKPEAKILKIDSEKDLNKWVSLPILERAIDSLLDYEELSKHFDCIWLTIKGQNDTRFSHPASLYGWDCETVLLFNSNCVTSLNNQQLAK